MWVRILFSSFLSIGIHQLCNAQIIISINHTNEKANISNQTGFFTDTTDAIPFADIVSGSYDDKFMVPGENKKGPPGIIRTSIWCHFGIRNQTDEKLILHSLVASPLPSGWMDWHHGRVPRVTRQEMWTHKTIFCQAEPCLLLKQIPGSTA